MRSVYSVFERLAFTTCAAILPPGDMRVAVGPSPKIPAISAGIFDWGRWL